MYKKHIQISFDLLLPYVDFIFAECLCAVSGSYTIPGAHLRQLNQHLIL